MLNVVYKSILIAPIIAIFIAASTTTITMAQLDPAQGHNDGVAAAQADANSGVPMQASCVAHGINNVGNEQYCFNYKVGYAEEQLALGLSK